MRGRIDVIEALEEIVKTRAGTELVKDGGRQTDQKLMKGQEEFSSQVFTREYNVVTGNGQRARIKFIYDYRVNDTFASVFIPLRDIIAIKQGAKDLDRQLAHTRGNGHGEFPVVKVNENGAEVNINP